MKILLNLSVITACLVAGAIAQDAKVKLDLADPNAPKAAAKDRLGLSGGPAAKPEAPAPAQQGGTTINAGDGGIEDPTLVIMEKLKPEQRKKVEEQMNEASTYVSGIRIQEGLQKLGEIDKVAPGLFSVENLRGAAYTKIRDFVKARECFDKAQKLNPKSFHPRFNLAEIEFVEKKFPVAEAAFRKLLEDKLDVSTRKLIEFKIVICLLKQEKTADAEKMTKTFSYLDDEPVYYMSHAAIEFAKGSKEEAQTWIDSASRIYQPADISVYVDSFIEMDWVESLSH